MLHTSEWVRYEVSRGPDLTVRQRNHLQSEYWGLMTSYSYGRTASGRGALLPRSAGPPSELCSSPLPAPASDSKPGGMVMIWSWYTRHVLNIHAHGIENNDGKLKLIDMEGRICSDPCHGVCLRFRWQLIVMNLYTDLVSFGPEPKTTVTEAQDWMSLQSNLRCATRWVFPTVKLLLLGDVQPYFMQLKLLQQHVELHHRLMTIVYICLQMPTETCWVEEKKICELIQKKLFFNSYQSHLNKKPRHCQPQF